MRQYFSNFCKERTDIFTVSEATTIEKFLHARLYLSGSPIPLSDWFRNGNTRCKVAKKLILRNFHPILRNFQKINQRVNFNWTIYWTNCLKFVIKNLMMALSSVRVSFKFHWCFDIFPHLRTNLCYIFLTLLEVI